MRRKQRKGSQESQTEAVRVFLEEAGKMGTLEQILQEADYSFSKRKLASPKYVSVQRVSVPLPLTHA
jgi:hypothetical protein